jgi:hypothetical protein
VTRNKRDGIGAAGMGVGVTFAAGRAAAAQPVPLEIGIGAGAASFATPMARTLPLKMTTAEAADDDASSTTCSPSTPLSMSHDCDLWDPECNDQPPLSTATKKSLVNSGNSIVDITSPTEPSPSSDAECDDLPPLSTARKIPLCEFWEQRR